MRVRIGKILWVALALSFLFASAGLGATITFNNLTGNNLDPFSTYAESGFTVTSTNGQWFKGFVFGDPVPDLFAGPVFGTTPDTLAVTDGGQFTFVSFNLASNNGTTGYSITGKNGVNTVFTQTGSAGDTSSSFITVASSHVNLITELDITLEPQAGAPAPTSYNIDNIRVNATVPEPASFPVLLGLAGASVFALTRRASTGR